MKLGKIFILQFFSCFSVYLSYSQSDTLSVYFLSAAAEVTPVHKNLINEVFNGFEVDVQFDIQVVGWTDNVGTKEVNQRLSEERAVNVYTYLNTYFPKKIHSIQYRGEGELKENLAKKDKRKVMIFFSKERDEPTILDSLNVGETLVLENLIFEPGRHYLKQESIPHLVELFKTLDQNKTVQIQIEGHVWAFYVDDTDEGREKAQILSERRAENIYNFLIRKGISSDRLSYKGYGIEQPLPLSTFDPSLNRRVEIRILKK